MSHGSALFKDVPLNGWFIRRPHHEYTEDDTGIFMKVSPGLLREDFNAVDLNAVETSGACKISDCEEVWETEVTARIRPKSSGDQR